MLSLLVPLVAPAPACHNTRHITFNNKPAGNTSDTPCFAPIRSTQQTDAGLQHADTAQHGLHQPELWHTNQTLLT
jgi:hypothetical protein